MDKNVIQGGCHYDNCRDAARDVVKMLLEDSLRARTEKLPEWAAESFDYYCECLTRMARI